jgi:hypothetical protein
MTIPHVACTHCALDDPHARTRHHFDWMERGLDQFREHLEGAYAQHPRGATAVSSLLAWASTLVQQYSGLAHPETGHPLGWRAARQRFLAQPPARPAARQEDTPQTPADATQMAFLGSVLRTLLIPPGQHAWAQCWRWLYERGFTRPGRARELAAACRLLADDYPEDRDDWVRHAARIEREALERPTAGVPQAAMRVA